MKILVVDDHTLIREALRGVLQELKPEAGVIDASSCREALELAQANAAELDLVLFDLGLPDGDGFETLGELRDLYPAVAIVVLSASKGSRQRDQGARSGCARLHPEIGLAGRHGERPAIGVCRGNLCSAGDFAALTKAPMSCARVCPDVALRAWADGTANRRACTHDAGEEQQSCLP